jgi:CDP-diacylglycerol--serine O-phosphatidyltransferase
VPTPANSILICSIPLILFFNYNFTAVCGPYFPADVVPLDAEADSMLFGLMLNTNVLLSLTIFMSYMLVAELPLFALKFKNFSWPVNKLRYTFLIISFVLLILFQFIAIPFIIFLYIILSVINNRVDKRNRIN